ncbi:MAG: GAF domain-containing protein, partial [Anaerolineales bacterium]
EFDAQVVMIGTYDLENGIQQPRYLIEMGKRIHLPPSPIGPAASLLFQSRKTLCLNTPEELDAHGMHTIAGTQDVKSAIWVPLVVGSKVTGSISLQHIDREHAFTEGDVQLLEMLANSMSLALESARLFDESQQRNAELAIINSVQQGLAKKLDVKEIYELVGDQVRELTNAQTLAIYSVDHAAQTISFEYIWENGARLYPPPRPLSPLNKYLIEMGEPLMMNEGMAEFLREYDHSIPAGEMPKAVITVPFISNGVYTGAISLQDTQHEHAFTENDLRLLETLAGSVSVAIDNARLFAETQRLLDQTAQRAAELATVNTVSQGLVSEIDLDALIYLTGEQMRSIFEADIVYVALIDRQTNLIHFPYHYGEEYESIEFGQGLTSKILA